MQRKTKALPGTEKETDEEIKRYAKENNLSYVNAYYSVLFEGK